MELTIRKSAFVTLGPGHIFLGEPKRVPNRDINLIYKQCQCYTVEHQLLSENSRLQLEQISITAINREIEKLDRRWWNKRGVAKIRNLIDYYTENDNGERGKLRDWALTFEIVPGESPLLRNSVLKFEHCEGPVYCNLGDADAIRKMLEI